MLLSKKPPSTLSRYEDPTGEFSNRALEAGTWWVRHQQLFVQIGTGLLLVWGVGSVAFGLLYWGYYIFFGAKDDTRLVEYIAQSAQNYEVTHRRTGAAPLVFGSTEVFDMGTGRYTFAVPVTNPNEVWFARLTYHIRSLSVDFPTTETVVLPGVTRPVAVFGQPMEAYPADAQIIIDRVDWRRIAPEFGLSPLEQVRVRTEFFVEDVAVTQLTEGGSVSPMISFRVRNGSSYGYGEGVFIAELLQGEVVVGMVPLTIAPFEAFSSKAIDLRVSADLSGVSDIRLTPVINVFDPEVFLAPPTQ